MLTEFKGVTQQAGAGPRRWFEADGMELVVWYHSEGKPEGFQLCYVGRDRREHALTWREGQGFGHALVDGGDTRPDKNLTPILVRDGAVPWQWLRERFAGQAAELDVLVRGYVEARLQEGGA